MSLGLFGTLSLAARSLQTQQQGVEVAGHNLANATNPAYARQRLSIQTSLPVPSQLGQQGTGAEAVAIQQIRSILIDHQIQTELSVSGYWNSQQQALQYAQAALGEQIDRLASGASGAAAAGGVGGQQGIATGLSALFSAFQSLSTNPTSLAERQVLLQKAADLASQFNQVDLRLGDLRTALNQSIQDDVSSANQLLSDIASLNDQIVQTEMSSGIANDLRDLRQQKIETLSKLVKIDTSAQPNGAVNISIAGTDVVQDKNVLDTLEAYDAGGGQFLVRTVTGGTTLTLTGGSIQGAIDVRDGTVATLKNNLDTLSGLLISEVNTAHAAGFSLTNSTGAAFFTGTDASTIAVNSTLAGNPALIQASGATGAVGDNAVALALAQLAYKTHASLNSQTFSQSYDQTVAALGQSLASANGQIADQQIVENMLNTQRSSVSGVSIDEEMTDLIKFQRAYQASARIVSIIDQMLEELVNMKR